MIFQFNWEWISNQMKGICNSEYLLFTNCCIVGDSFFPFVTKNVKKTVLAIQQAPNCDKYSFL